MCSISGHPDYKSERIPCEHCLHKERDVYEIGAVARTQEKKIIRWIKVSVEIRGNASRGQFKWVKMGSWEFKGERSTLADNGTYEQ